MVGLRDGTLHIHQGGGHGLTEATKVLATLANPNTRLNTHNPTHGTENQPSQVEIETVADDNPEAVQANLGFITPQTNISVHVTHQNTGNVEPITATETELTATGRTVEDDADRIEAATATKSTSEASEITDFILGALESVADFQKQESRQLMETLGKTLVQGIRAMKTSGGTR